MEQGMPHRARIEPYPNIEARLTIPNAFML
jgi:hypothetical protein